MKSAFNIRETSLVETVQLMQALPEFTAPYDLPTCRDRLQGKPHLVLGAYAQKVLVGFKVGYERDGYFYSWLGGVLPDWRRKGIAQALADAQETWVKQQGYTEIRFKTRNRHRAMLLFGISNGFELLSVEPRAARNEHRIWLGKML